MASPVLTVRPRRLISHNKITASRISRLIYPFLIDGTPTCVISLSEFPPPAVLHLQAYCHVSSGTYGPSTICTRARGRFMKLWNTSRGIFEVIAFQFCTSFQLGKRLRLCENHDAQKKSFFLQIQVEKKT